MRPGFNPLVGKIPWWRERLATPVFWPGEFHRLYSPWSHKESDTTERISLSLSPALERHWTYPESSYRFHKNCIEVVCLVVSDFATPWTAAHQSPRSVGILPARILEWVAVSSFRGSSQLCYQTQVSRIGGGFFTDWTTRGRTHKCHRNCIEGKDAFLSDLSSSLVQLPFPDKTCAHAWMCQHFCTVSAGVSECGSMYKLAFLHASERASPAAHMVKNLPAIWETNVWFLGQEDPLDKELTTPPVVFPGESHGQRSLVGYTAWGHKESNTTEQLTHTCFWERNSKDPLMTQGEKKTGGKFVTELWIFNLYAVLLATWEQVQASLFMQLFLSPPSGSQSRTLQCPGNRVLQVLKVTKDTCHKFIRM